jgi:hypothetical protein
VTAVPAAAVLELEEVDDEEDDDVEVARVVDAESVVDNREVVMVKVDERESVLDGKLVPNTTVTGFADVDGVVVGCEVSPGPWVTTATLQRA